MRHGTEFNLSPPAPRASRPLLDSTQMVTRVENLTEVAPSVFELRLPIPWEDEFVNVFLLAGDGHVDLIDCGMNSAASIDTIRRAVRSVGGDRARGRRLLITHIHPDHYGAAGLLTPEDGAELCLHRLG